ncbi:dihydrodipicolinate synthase family protein [Halostagnicola sp. A-GB9-2]|uniref:dihydrodipicolinate synthase family protein n=1 Tax=Halostagnicola sp. A-GB9-2 TaxID=3048066 RepID=UPI0024C09615|nr:dihydrodipicolinate synthase family protein [Halostagnicola sp. A-GB9-2]MDJ1433230.1 dihydrodipicolinate synthase family protein [Halostagnicola sp. A-GB9-2]
MASTKLRDGLRDVAVGLLTPFDEAGRIDHEKLAANAEALSSEGLGTFLACANISEYHSLTHQERIDITETSVKALSDDDCVLAGVGGSTKTAQDLVSTYDRLGVDAMMIMPPDHTYLHERGLLEYYEALAETAESAIVPYVRGFEPSVEFLADLTRIDNVAGIKYAIPDEVKLGQAIAAGDDDVIWVDGMAEPYALSFWSQGAEGFTAGVTNFEPRLGTALLTALREENWERARELQNAAVPYQQFRTRTGEDNSLADAISVPAVKYGLELAGYNGGDVREPIVPLTESEKTDAEELYERLQSDLDRIL